GGGTGGAGGRSRSVGGTFAAGRVGRVVARCDDAGDCVAAAAAALHRCEWPGELAGCVERVPRFAGRVAGARAAGGGMAGQRRTRAGLADRGGAAAAGAVGVYGAARDLCVTAGPAETVAIARAVGAAGAGECGRGAGPGDAELRAQSCDT